MDQVYPTSPVEWNRPIFWPAGFVLTWDMAKLKDIVAGWMTRETVPATALVNNLNPLPPTAPIVAVIEESPVLPVWHADVAKLDPQWADEAAEVLSDLSLSDQQMVKSNAFGSDPDKATMAYGLLLKQMTQLEEDTVKRDNAGWLDNLHRKLLGDARPLVDRMEELMRNRNLLVSAARNRVNGLRGALDLREDVDARATALLDRLPDIEQAARDNAESATQALAEITEDADFSAFRTAQLQDRAAAKLPGVLLGVRQQLQNAVLLGAPLRDSIDQFLHVEEMNQSRFEISFGAHISNLAVLQGMQQSARNSQAASDAIEQLPYREAGSSFNPSSSGILDKVKQRRGQVQLPPPSDRPEPQISDRPPSVPLDHPVEPVCPSPPRIRRVRI